MGLQVIFRETKHRREFIVPIISIIRKYKEIFLRTLPSHHFPISHRMGNDKWDGAAEP